MLFVNTSVFTSPSSLDQAFTYRLVNVQTSEVEAMDKVTYYSIWNAAAGSFSTSKILFNGRDAELVDGDLYYKTR